MLGVKRPIKQQIQMNIRENLSAECISIPVPEWSVAIQVRFICLFNKRLYIYIYNKPGMTSWITRNSRFVPHRRHPPSIISIDGKSGSSLSGQQKQRYMPLVKPEFNWSNRDIERACFCVHVTPDWVSRTYKTTKFIAVLCVCNTLGFRDYSCAFLFCLLSNPNLV